MPSRLNTLHIFCDFDGTISSIDIGDALFAEFGRQEPYRTQLKSRELHIRDYWKVMAANLMEPLTHEKLDRFLLSIPPDPGFAGLLELVRANGIPFTIVSDGFDLYIDRYLELHGFEPIPTFCNQARLTSEGGMDIAYPHAVEGCECFCATCKRNVVLTESAPDARIVHIGDGISDYCPAEHADIIFAKGALAAYCNERSLPHHPFRTLHDVTRVLRGLIERRRIRPRRQAELKRRRSIERE